MSAAELQLLLGQMDIYLLDQLLRGRIPAGARILDAGCGFGRNLVYFLRQGYEVFAMDRDPEGVEHVRQMAATFAPQLAADHFRVGPIEAMPFPDGSVDVVISNAVLHFAQDDGQFHRMLHEQWRVLKPGGLLFCRLASSIGLENLIQHVAGRRFLLPDGSERYLVDEAQLLQAAASLGGRMVDPLKTTLVQNERCMTTWVLLK